MCVKIKRWLEFIKILQFVSGIGTIVIIVAYFLGMSYKIYKISRGDYIEEEPIFIKYK